MKIQIRTVDMPHPAERRRLRLAAGLTGVELAMAIGVSPASVYAGETGLRVPTGLLRSAYLEALNEIIRQLDARGPSYGT